MSGGTATLSLWRRFVVWVRGVGRTAEPAVVEYGAAMHEHMMAKAKKAVLENEVLEAQAEKLRAEAELIQNKARRESLAALKDERDLVVSMSHRMPKEVLVFLASRGLTGWWDESVTPPRLMVQRIAIDSSDDDSEL